jgi:predicted RNase H-like HicB family nuclease
MGSGLPDDTDVLVINGLTVVTRRQPDGTYTSEVTDLPGCTARAGTREELPKATERAISAFLGR